MTIIVFLVDTSASMQQRAFVSGRSTLLDIAKGAVEFFVKLRQKSPESRGDRYMLLTFEDVPKNIKAGWKENLQTFLNELKNLEASGMTTMSSALKQVFDILNINRMQSGIDMYGQGRYPFYLEPAVIIVISDGGKITTQGAVQSEIHFPNNCFVPGHELTKELFRWDQRMYALVLKMSGTPPMMQETGHVANDSSPIDTMCELTGGRSYAVTSQRVLHQCIDSLVQKLQSGVVIHFEKVGPDPAPVRDGENTPDEDPTPLLRADTIPLDELQDEDEEVLSAKGLNFSRDATSGSGSTPSRPHTPNPILAPSNTAWHNCRRLIFVPRSAQKGFAVGFWPLPESFWPDVNSLTLPPRNAHPSVKFSCTNYEPMIIENLPFDKYELEPSPLTQYILARKQPKVCWQVYIPGSAKSVITQDQSAQIHPFGYLKASTNLMTVNLFVLPYNYPLLLPLLDELFKAHRLKPTNDWKNSFHSYIRSMPAYYAGPLRRALTRMGAGNLANSLIPEGMDNCLSYSVLNYLKRIKNQAKNDYEKILNSNPVTRARAYPDGIKVLSKSSFKKELLNNVLIKDKFIALRDQLTDFPGFQLGIKDNSLKFDRLRNPFDVPRNALLDQIIRMRANFLQPFIANTKLIDDDSTHSLPIAQMGNYQDYLKKMPVPLREIESTPVRQHMFGNPFKINKNMIMDEVVLDEVSFTGTGGTFAPSPQLNRGIKRQPDPIICINSKRAKKGPLPRDFIYRRTPPGTPSHNWSDCEMSSPCTSPVPSDTDSELEDLTVICSQQENPIKSEHGPHPELKPETFLNGNSLNEFLSETDQDDSAKIDRTDVKLEKNENHKVEIDNVSIVRLIEQNGSCDSNTNDELIVSPKGTKEDSTNCTESSHQDQSPSSVFESHFEDNSSSFSPDLLLPKPENIKIEPVGEVKSLVNGKLPKDSDRDLENGSPKCDTPPILQENNLGKEEIRRISVLNQNMRQMIYKEVKRPGKNHAKLFEMLGELHGPPVVRRAYIDDVIREAKRFKRESLVYQIEQQMERLVIPRLSI